VTGFVNTCASCGDKWIKQHNCQTASAAAPVCDNDRLRAALREIAGVLDSWVHDPECSDLPTCVCGITKIRAIVERAVGGES